MRRKRENGSENRVRWMGQENASHVRELEQASCGDVEKCKARGILIRVAVDNVV